MWLFNSSIGKKFIMALTGICLVLFVTFHVLMNAVAICCPVAYNKVCMFLGANWYALIASMGLGALVVIHIIDAIVLTVQNRKARGNNRYAVNSCPKGVEWSSQNMLVLGFVVLAFLGVHLVQFWARMQFQEVIGATYEVNDVPVVPQAGTLFLQLAFQEIWTPIVYIIGFVALWFHMNHGFWSMWQTIGWNNTAWLPRLKKIACWWVSIVIALFVIQAVVFTINARSKYYLNAPELIDQYNEMYIEHYTHEKEVVESQIIAIFDEFSEQHPDFSGYSPRFYEIQDSIQKANKELFDRYAFCEGVVKAAQSNALKPALQLLAPVDTAATAATPAPAQN